MTSENENISKQSEKDDEPVNIMQRYFHWSLLEAIIVLSGFAGLTIGAYIWIKHEIDATVEKKLSDPKILRQIAAESRPMIVFDSNESILADMGAGQFIKSISVTSSKAEDGKLPTTIIIDFSTHLPVAPILTPLNYGDGLTINSQRGKGYSWVYKLSYGLYMESPKVARSYRIEILR